MLLGQSTMRRSMQIGVICLLLRLSCIDIGLLWCIYVKSPSTSRDIFTIINRLPYRQQTHSTARNGYTLMGFYRKLLSNRKLYKKMGLKNNENYAYKDFYFLVTAVRSLPYQTKNITITMSHTCFKGSISS